MVATAFLICGVVLKVGFAYFVANDEDVQGANKHGAVSKARTLVRNPSAHDQEGFAVSGSPV